MEIPDGGSSGWAVEVVDEEVCGVVLVRDSREVRTPERIATPIVPQPVFFSLFAIPDEKGRTQDG